jgi:hypothetical protein
MDKNGEQVKLFYNPKIYVTAEQAARVLGISLEKANVLLSAPDTYSIVEAALKEGLAEIVNGVFRNMARARWPQETIPIRVDCHVDLPILPALSADVGKLG